jgi:radical SAM superfamily enzyme YgiQ (UPF0313 family)
MKLLFINALNRTRNIESSYPHLGFGYIAAYLDKHLSCPCEVKVIDDNIENTMRKFQPDIVGVSSVSQNFTIAKKICAQSRSFGICTVVGGVHISMLPESLDHNMDCGVIGEGEKTMLEITEAFLLHGCLKPHVLADLAGIVYRDKGGSIRTTPMRKPIKPLDRLPMPKREILSVVSNGMTSMFTSRGCPYDCVFCASTRYWHGMRMFSPEYIISELKDVVNRYHPRYISFKDDLFIANKQRFDKIVEYICKEGLNRKIGFFISCRANLINKEIARLLKEMNVVHASMGLESGCSRTLSYLKGDSVTVQQGPEAVEYLVDAGIHVNASFIIGSPYETREEIMETLAFIKKSRLSSFLTYAMIPYPGTPIWDYALGRGLVSVDMDWSRLTVDFANSDSNPIILSETLSSEELRELYMLFKKEGRKRRNAIRFKKLSTSPLTVIKSFIWKRIN